jgi:hypothetical protein
VCSGIDQLRSLHVCQRDRLRQHLHERRELRRDRLLPDLGQHLSAGSGNRRLVRLGFAVPVRELRRRVLLRRALHGIVPGLLGGTQGRRLERRLRQRCRRN